MKFSNNPSRKNERRKRALAQLMHPRNTKAKRLGREGFNRELEISEIQKIIQYNDSVRGIRTKKWRGDRGKLR